jgi:hypothetical protein
MLPAPRSPDGRTIREDRDLAGLGSATSIMPVTNPLERLIGEIKRRTDVAGHLTDRGRDRPPCRRCCSKQNSLETLAAFGHSDQLRLSAVAA